MSDDEKARATGRRQMSANANRIANLLCVGHGAALLLIFNAAATADAPLPVGIKGAAWIFSIGLIAAFLMIASVFGFEETDLQPLKIGETLQERQAKLAQHSAHGGTCYVVSGGAFLVGLLTAISFLPAAAPHP